MATDAVGFSRLMHADEDDTLDALRSAHELLEAEAKKRDGRVFSRAGDSALVEFIDASAAVEAAIAFQQAIEARNRRHDRNRRMRFRIGINLGTAVAEGENLLGDCVNVAARLEGLSEPGGVCISGAVYEQAKGQVGAKFDNLGGRRLKNIDDPVRVYRVRVGRKRRSIYDWGEETAESLLRRARILDPVDADGEPETADDSRSGAQRRAGHAKPKSPVRSDVVFGGSLHDGPADSEPHDVFVEGPETASATALAVLPFASDGDVPGLQYCADLLSEELIEALGRVPGLFVIAPRSSFAMGRRRADPAAVGRRLGVLYLVVGEVDVVDERVRVDARLVDQANETVVWQHAADVEFTDVQGIVGEIWPEVALRLGVAKAEFPSIERQPPASIEAYAFLRQADRAAGTFTDDGHEEALRLLRRAIATDRSSARAHASLSLLSARDVWLRWAGDGRSVLDKALEAAMNARDLDQLLPLAHVAEANAALWMKDHRRAARAADRALGLAPSNADALEVMGAVSLWSGRPADAVAPLKTAMRADPLNPTMYLFDLGHAYFCVGHYEDARSAFLRGSIRNPRFTLNQIYLAAAHAHLGERAEARRVIERCNEDRPGLAIGRVLEVLPYAKLDDTDRVGDAFHKAGIGG